MKAGRERTEDDSRCHLVGGALFVLSLITYIDRAAISTANGPLTAKLSLSARFEKDK